MAFVTEGFLGRVEVPLQTYYVSLCRDLVGCYVKFKATSRESVINYAATYFGNMWCSVYNERYYNEHIAGRYSIEHVINADRPIVIEGD